MEHWSKVKKEELDTRGIDLSSPCDFKAAVRAKSPLKAVRLTFRKDRMNILDEFIKLHGKEKLSDFILKKLEDDKSWKPNTTLQQSLKF